MGVIGAPLNIAYTSNPSDANNETRSVSRTTLRVLDCLTTTKVAGVMARLERLFPFATQES